nr:hypothetical protein [Kibdelosporangium sp. MJ126-NF4]
MAHESNDLLRAARDHADLTQGQLAELANAEVERLTGKLGAMDADYVGKLERGVHTWPNKHYRQALRSVLVVTSDAELGFRSTRHRGITVGSNSRRVNRGEDDMERKAFLRVLAGSIAGMTFVDPVDEFVARASSGDAYRRVGRAEVAHIRHMARMFASQDHVFGGTPSAQAVVAQLSTSAELLDGQVHTDSVRQALFSAVGDLADTAAGMCFDAGMHHYAERCFRFSVGCATESGDWALRAKALSGMANLAVHQNRPDDALSFSEMALVRMDRLSPVVRAVMHTRHARALGSVGPERGADCVSAVHRAEDAFAERGGDEPEWIRYYDAARLERDSGRALLSLALNGGDHREAQRRLRSAIDDFPADHSRGKALAMVNLAVLTMAREDPAHAVELGTTALESMGHVRSNRVVEALKQLRDRGKAHSGTPCVRELNRKIDEVLRTGQT